MVVCEQETLHSRHGLVTETWLLNYMVILRLVDMRKAIVEVGQSRF